MTLTEIIEKIDRYLRGSISLRELSSDLLEYSFPEDENGSPSAFLVAEALAASIDHFEQGLPEEHARVRILAALSQVVPLPMPGVTGANLPPSPSTWSTAKTAEPLLTR